MVRRGWLPLTVTLAIAGASARAQASSCDFPSYPVTAPELGAQDVPTNTRIWLATEEWSPVPEVVLLGPDGLEVALTGTTMTFAPFGWLGTVLSVWTPDQPLAPDTDYAVWSCEDSVCRTAITEFRTGAGPSTAPPPVPALAEAEGTRGCGTRSVLLSADFTGVLVVDLVDGELDPAALTGHGVHVSQAPRNSFPWPDVGDGVTLKIGALGLDGSFSGWSDPIVLDARGCTIAAAPRLPLLLVLLLGLRRRRRA